MWKTKPELRYKDLKELPTVNFEKKVENKTLPHFQKSCENTPDVSQKWRYYCKNDFKKNGRFQFINTKRKFKHRLNNIQLGHFGNNLVIRVLDCSESQNV